MSMQFDQIAARAAADGFVGAEEVLALRQVCWPDGQISQAEAEGIFALNEKLTERTDEWVAFFVEALSEFAVMQLAPRGYVSEENADWLMARVDRDGMFGSMAECELLVRVFERASNVPGKLKDWALARIETAVLEGTGPTRDGGSLEASNVNATEAWLLRRVLFAPAGDRPAGVGRKEAELLFRLKDATLDAENASEWKQLFVQGVANYLEGFAAPAAQISRERAAELEAFVADNRPRFGGFLGKVLLSKADWSGAAKEAVDEGEAFDDRDGLVEEGAKVTAREQNWLDGHIYEDGKVDEYEQALLRFLAEGHG